MPRPPLIGPRPACTVAECFNEQRARGYCAAHWAMWRKYGTPTPSWPETCTASEGCERPVRSMKAGLCEMHYYRLRRTGTTDARPVVYADPAIEAAHKERKPKGLKRVRSLEPRLRIAGECQAPDCSKPMGVAKTRLCRMHDLRLRKYGDINRDNCGPQNRLWTGDAATAGAVHQRLRKARGKAKSWSCTDCARPAAHWSYDHLDPNERPDPEKGPYSLDLDHYFPRCVRCHKRFDMDFIMQRRAAA